MRRTSSGRAIAFVIPVLLGVLVRVGNAQGITTGAIAGTVTDSGGTPVAEAQIQVRHLETGVVSRAATRANGAYFVQGLEVGGPYEVTVRRIGFAPAVKDGFLVKLAQVTRADFMLSAAATQLQSVTVVATTNAEIFQPSNQGIKAVVSDTALQRIPSINRNLIDFVRMAPQVSQSGPGFSAGGMSNRMNNVQIDGSTERDVFGLGSTGQPGAQANARSVPIESVKELQVVLAPFDVRQGNFGGLLLNAVTKGGTNEMSGTVYYYYRNEKFGADTNILRATPFERKNFGFSLGGPIIRDKLHFFINPEFEREDAPVSGPYAGQPANAPVAFPITDADRQRYEQLMAAAGLPTANLGSSGYVNIPNPVDNLFARLDWRINPTHRLVARYNYGTAERLRQQNNRTQSAVVYSSNFHDFSSSKHAPVVQLYSNFSNGTFNELFVGYNRVQDRRVPLAIFPQISVSTNRVGGGSAVIISGADQFSQGNELDQETFELTNNFTMPMGSHTMTFGTRNELVKIRNLFTQSSFGVWSFRNLDSLAAGNPNTFRRAFILRDGGNVFFDALQSAWYAQDQWRVGDRLNVNLGVRFDVSRFLSDVAYSAAIDSAYGRRTDEIPRTSVQFSPRVGFNWDVTGDRMNQLRGGFGLFVGTPPYVWLENAYINNGEIITFLNCNTGGSRDPAPAFSANIATMPTACRNGAGSNRPIGAVNFLDKDLKFPQPLRFSLGYDRQLPGDLVATVEGLYSKTLNQLFFVNRNLAGPRGTDRNGRVLYGDSIRTNGQAIPTLPASVLARGGASRFSEAIDVENQSKDFAWSFTTQLRKRYSNNWEGMVAYTHSRARDVQSFSSSTHISNWRFGRTLAGRQEDKTLATSLFDQPHKIAASATYTFEWMRRRLNTDVSLFYQGVSGSPHDYVYNSTSGSGDANADGATLNDLIYVPKNALDVNEIRFRDQTVGGTTITAAAQAQAFENFIENSECLSSYRGRILERNACRLPFFNQVDFSLRQGINVFGKNRLTITYDIFNLGNLLNKDWGKIQVHPASGNSNVPIITHVGQTTADPKTAVGIYRFNVNQQEYIDGLFVSNFWRSQLAVRWAF